MTEQPAAEYIAYLEATWEPATPCEFPGHEKGAAGCIPDTSATWIVETLHLSCYDAVVLPEPIRRMVRYQYACAGRVVVLRAHADDPASCLCGFRGTLGDLLRFVPVIPPKPATLES